MSTLHYLHEISDGGERERFVYSCSECSCVLNVCAALEPVGDTVESLENRCPGCGSALEARVSCRSARIPEAWPEISRSAYARSARAETKVEYQTAASLRGFSFNFAPLDALVAHYVDPNWSVAFAGRCANAVAEFLCFRAQLPKEAGGSDSSVVLIDGGNRSDLYLFSSYAKLYGVAPRKALRRVVTSRAFTMYQMADLVVNQLGKVVDEYGAKVVVLSDVFGHAQRGVGAPRGRGEEARGRGQARAGGGEEGEEGPRVHDAGHEDALRPGDDRPRGRPGRARGVRRVHRGDAAQAPVQEGTPLAAVHAARPPLPQQPRQEGGRRLAVGRTTPSFRIAEAQEIEEWRRFRRALPKGERAAFDEMLNAARLYASASSAAVRTSRFEGMAMAIAFHHFKALAEVGDE